ncbi:hypothetical protein LEP1GSC008_1031 [Leptospira kirschneri serovar Bulgarica str. Nikolaevo]|uniref:Uncharacterized protein n=1 Tax=Leptospira kirschneri serovar Bulgarica str. Nikolaevo TaxID=1240687 RepID=M6FGN6_9LEPT|nr:hypothetical protein LEP1GSC008_1031 [Leptospira kirschneri serovar Bulgarica str. Nikolaevo]
MLEICKKMKIRWKIRKILFKMGILEKGYLKIIEEKSNK